LPQNSELQRNIWIFIEQLSVTLAIDHRTLKTGLPVRSAVLKQCAVTLVVGWVTTSESVMLIVFVFFGSYITTCRRSKLFFLPDLSFPNAVLGMVSQRAAD
jgi:hypothetical protein